MERVVYQSDNYTYYDYRFSQTTVRYVVMKEGSQVFLLLLPRGMEDEINNVFRTVKVLNKGCRDSFDWYPGSLVHLHLAHHATPVYDNSFKLSETTKNLQFAGQEVYEETGKEIIRTLMSAGEGYTVCHELAHYREENGFEISCTFTNHTGKTVILEMITSASLDNLSPFMTDDGSRILRYHCFKGGWATEGKHTYRTLPELNMEKSWGGSFECEKINSVGSKSVGRYHPYAALEDTAAGCTWGIKLKHNSSWQIELSRYGTPLSLSAGIADMKSGAWRKEIQNGESFQTPTAYVAVARGGIAEVSNDLLQMNDRDIEEFGEEGMPILFNDWATNWGDTSEEKMLSLANSLKDSRVKYFIVDDGWQTGGVGDWVINRERFPHGIREYAEKIRSMGKVPGIWMEFETVRESAERFAPEYDEYYLKKDGTVLVNATSNVTKTKFLDFRKDQVQEYLSEKVIRFLKENHIGYLKVDSNANIGLGCDGPDSFGENLRQQMIQVCEFFKRIKREIPDMIIENCASGGARLDPMMMGVTAMSSFSDSIECLEVPIIAASMHYLISPRQSQVWCVLKNHFDVRQMQYVISAGFLGRICWSGFIDRLTDWQREMMLSAELFYENVCDIIKDGRSTIYRSDEVNYRYPKGVQTVVRYSADRTRALVVYHGFEQVGPMRIPLKGDYRIADSLYTHACTIEDDELVVRVDELDGNVLLLKSGKADFSM